MKWTREEVFDCQALCRKTGTSELDEDTREARNCTLVHPRPVTRWRSSELIQINLGLRTRWDWEGQKEHKDFMAPHEDIQEEGCPSGWYRSAFVSSIHKYRRRGSETKTDNLLLSRCQDRLVLEAIAYLEDEEGHALGAFYEARDSDG